MASITETIPNFGATETPLLTQPSTFSLYTDNYHLKLGSVISSINTWSTQANAVKDEINTKYAQVATDSNLAQQASLNAQASANFKGVWSGATAYTIGQSVLGSDNVFYVCLVNNTNQDPTSTTGYWKVNVPMGAVGRIMSPLLDLSLKNSLVMKAGVGSVTYTNATGNRTYIDRYGVLKYAGIDEPRFEKDGLLIEGSSTNLLTYSEQFDNAIWNKARATISANAVLAPDGNLTADKLVEDTTLADTHLTYQVVTLTATNKYTFSIFAKAGERSKITLIVTSSSDNATFDLINGTVGSISAGLEDYRIEYINNGWYRCSVTATEDTGGSTNAIVRLHNGISNSYDGDGISGVYLWGGQLEALPFASLYIPTTTAQVTRSQDICKISRSNNTVASFGDSTTYIKFKHKGSLSGSILGWLYMDGSSTNYAAFIRDTGYGSLREGAVTTELNIGLNSEHSLVTTNNNEAISTYLDGALAGTGTGRASVATNDYIYLGADFAGNSPMFGHISAFAKWDYALTATEVALLGGKTV